MRAVFSFLVAFLAAAENYEDFLAIKKKPDLYIWEEEHYNQPSFWSKLNDHPYHHYKDTFGDVSQHIKECKAALAFFTTHQIECGTLVFFKALQKKKKNTKDHRDLIDQRCGDKESWKFIHESCSAENLEKILYDMSTTSTTSTSTIETSTTMEASTTIETSTPSSIARTEPVIDTDGFSNAALNSLNVPTGLPRGAEDNSDIEKLLAFLRGVGIETSMANPQNVQN
eukprot:GHVP01046497.1.p1 GENE.GHVP01046497.1~~GHVP01046497.1.p1  ORF type:complete len:227 (+),score=42.48 GHVP01046497.1:338-1018(+)